MLGTLINVAAVTIAANAMTTTSSVTCRLNFIVILLLVCVETDFRNLAVTLNVPEPTTNCEALEPGRTSKALSWV
jgi:hypothetical protein